MPRRKAKQKPKRRIMPNVGTAWFLAIILISALAAIFPVDRTILYLVLGICGAIVAILNIKTVEQMPFLTGITALIIIILAIFNLPEISEAIISGSSVTPIGMFLINLVIAFGVAGFIVALGVVSKLGID